MKIILKTTLLLSIFLLASCVARPPEHPNNICSIFKQYPAWQRSTSDVSYRWKVPQSIQLAIIYQESSFKAHAKPPRTHLFFIIPWSRPSNAYGYTQALKSTWARYVKAQGHFFSSRSSFADGVDFIGWYANEAYQRAHISRTDAYALYLAYHEGIGGYIHQTYLKKPWLITVAKKVAYRAAMYEAALPHCL